MPPLAAGTQAVSDSIVFPGVSATLFPTGTEPALGLTLQSSRRGNGPDEPDVGGELVVIGPDEEGHFSRLGPGNRDDGLDLLLEPPGFNGLIRGISMAARSAGHIVMRLYNESNVLVGEHEFAVGVERVAVLGSISGLTRVNVYSPGQYVDVGEIRLYSAAGPPDAEHSTVWTAAEEGAFADVPVAVVATIRDAQGRIRDSGGDAISFAVSGGTLSISEDRRNGEYAVDLSRTTPGNAQVMAYLGATTAAPLIGSVQVNFVAGRAADIVELLADDEVIDSHGGTTQVRASVRDRYGNTPADVRVYFESSAPGRATVEAEAYTDVNGWAVALVTGGNETGDVTLTASITAEDANVASNHSRSVSLRVRDPDWALSIEGWVAHDRVYDRTTAAHVTGPTHLVGARVEHDVRLEGEAIFNFASKSVGTNRLITVSGLNLVGDDAPLYTIDWPALRASILPAPLEVTGAVAQSKGFDGTTAAVVSGAQLSGVLVGDHVTLLNATTGTFAQAEIGTGLVVTTHMMLGGTDAGNYSLIQPVLFADIFYTPYRFFFNRVTVAPEFGPILDAGLYYLGRQDIPLLAMHDEWVMNVASVHPGVPAWPFASGTDEDLGISFYSNIRGTNAAVVDPGRPLIVIGPGAENDFGRVGVSDRQDSLDLVLEPLAFAGLVRSVTMAARASSDSELVLRLYNSDNELAAQHTFASGTERLGVLSDGPELVRLNLFAPSGFLEVGEIRIYTAAGPADANRSTIEVLSADPVEVGGSMQVRVTVKDGGDRIRSKGGDLVFFRAEGGTLGGFVDHRDGTYTIDVNRDHPGVVTVYAHLGGSAQAPTIGAASVSFVAGPATTIASFTTDTDVLGRDGGQTTLRARIVDAAGFETPGVRVHFSSSDADTVSVSPAFACTDDRGEAVATATAGAQTGTVEVFASLHAADEQVAVDDEASATLLIVAGDAIATISGWTAQGRVYDGTTSVTITGDAVLEGVQAGHDVTLAGLPGTFAFEQASAGANRRVLISGLSLTGDDAGLYVLQLPVLTAAITPKPVHVSGAVAQSKVYDGTTVAVIAGASLTGVIGGDAVSLDQASVGMFSQADAGTALPVSAQMTLGGADAANYELVLPVLSADIERAPQQIVDFAPQEGGFFWIGDIVSLRATASSGLPVAFELEAGSPGVLVGNRLLLTGFGEYVVLANQGGDANWLPLQNVQRRLSAVGAIPEVREVEFTLGGFVVRVAGNPGQTYELEWTPDLPDGSWQPLQIHGAADADGVSTLVDNDAPNALRFYRIQIVHEE